MKKLSQNSFGGGLKTDLSPLNTPSNILTDAVNTTLVTYNGNEFILQSLIGNAEIKNLNLNGDSNLVNIIPLAAKEYNNILYVILKGILNEKEVTAIGMYTGNVENFEINQFKFIENLYDNTEATPKLFITNNFPLSDNITIELQEAVDLSVNIIINDPENGIYLINSGVGDRLENFIGKYIDDANLKYQLSLTKNITTLGKCDFERVNEGGSLPVGTYFFYFKYIDGLNNESEIFAQEGPVMLYIGSPYRGFESLRGGLAEENSNKSISLTLKELDTNFDSISVYYSRDTSDLEESITTTYKKLTNPFNFKDSSLSLVITGLEEAVDVSYDEVNMKNLEFSTCKTITQSNGYLFGANLNNIVENDYILRQKALEISLKETRNSSDDIGFLTTYRNPGAISYDTIIIENELEYIDKLLLRIKEGKSKNIEFVINKDLNFNLNEKDKYLNTLKEINLPFEGILHGNSKTITIVSDFRGGSLFPFCKQCTVRDLNINVTLNIDNGKAEWKFNAKEWRDPNDNNDLYDFSKLNIYSLCNAVASSQFIRVNINSTINLSPVTYNIYNPNYPYYDRLVRVKGTPYVPTTPPEIVSIIRNIEDNTNLTDVVITNNVNTNSYEFLTFQGGSSDSANPIGNAGGYQQINSFFYVDNSVINNLVLKTNIEGKVSNLSNNPSSKYGYYPLLTLDILRDGSNVVYSNIICSLINVDYAGDTGLTNYSDGFQPGIISNRITYPGGQAKASIINTGTYPLYNYNGSWVDIVNTAPPIKKFPVNWMSTPSYDINSYLLNSKIYIHGAEQHVWLYYDITYSVYVPGTSDTRPSEDSFEYYSPYNVTHRLGYWADEYYRFGVQFIDILGRKSSVYNITGLINSSKNPYGIYKTTSQSQIQENSDTRKSIIPIGFLPIISFELGESLKSLGIKGYMIVRQPRIPTILCQGLTISKLTNSGLPFLNSFESINNTDKTLITQEIYHGAVTEDNTLFYNIGGLISPDIQLNSEYYSSVFTGATFKLTMIDYNISNFIQNTGGERRLFYAENYYKENNISDKESEVELIYIPEKCAGINYKNQIFRTIAGDASNNYSYEFLQKSDNYDTKYFRGEYSGYLGIANGGILSNTLINKVVNIENKKSENDELIVRSQDSNAYYPVSKARDFSDSTIIYKGDCFIGTYYQRINKNFITSDAPFQDGIINTEIKYPEGALPNSAGYGRPQDYKDVNLGDLNAVRLGQWVGFKCCSNVNHLYRTLDLTRPSERALFSQEGKGSEFNGARGFYPYYETTSAPYNKLLDSTTMNSGYNRTLCRLANFNIDEKNTLKKEFPTRVIFSRRHFGSSLINNYRIFDLLSYRDYPTNMGSITKILDFQGNLLIIFERGVGLAPIQERVAVGGGDGGNLFINSSQVLPERLKILSDKFGTTHPTSVIRTPFGVYGVDLEQRKIWRTNGTNFELISDFTIQKLLNETFEKISEKSCNFNNSILGFVHPYKNDVYFSFNLQELKEINCDFSITYSEVANCWSTKVKWSVPLHTIYRNNLLTFRKDRNEETTGEYLVWEHGLIKNINKHSGKFFNKQDNTEIEFIVGADSVNTQKIFENLKIISNNCFPSSIVYSITQGAYNPEEHEIEISTTQIPLDMRKYGRVKGTAMYKENLLDVTIKALPPSVQFPGWSSDSNTASIKRSAKLRDKYLRIKLIYDNSEDITLHSIITLFTDSFS